MWSLFRAKVHNAVIISAFLISLKTELSWANSNFCGLWNWTWTCVPTGGIQHTLRSMTSNTTVLYYTPIDSLRESMLLYKLFKIKKCLFRYTYKKSIQKEYKHAWVWCQVKGSKTDRHGTHDRKLLLKTIKIYLTCNHSFDTHYYFWIDFYTHFE